MSHPRFFLAGLLAPAGEDAVLPLSSDDVHHLRDVLRMVPGERVVVVSPDGTANVARLTGVREEVRAVVEETLSRTARPRVTLAQGLPKGAKLDDVVRQATELGVAAVVPFAAARSIVRLDAAKGEERAARWDRIAAQAAKQSSRVDVPGVSAPVSFEALLSLVSAADAAIVCWEEAGEGAVSVGAGLRAAGAGPDSAVVVVVGPEGGLSTAEVEWLVEAGAVTVGLGPSILRTETAAIAALALTLYELGGLG